MAVVGWSWKVGRERRAEEEGECDEGGCVSWRITVPSASLRRAIHEVGCGAFADYRSSEA